MIEITFIQFRLDFICVFFSPIEGGMTQTAYKNADDYYVCAPK